ncbi:MAG: hypothetical protein IT381_22325, partial [Deltaproteobacteria bacterium]|nr:hypothetical protein [Deltaproteobacteria bacterium]
MKWFFSRCEYSVAAILAVSFVSCSKSHVGICPTIDGACSGVSCSKFGISCGVWDVGCGVINCGKCSMPQDSCFSIQLATSLRHNEEIKKIKTPVDFKIPRAIKVSNGNATSNGSATLSFGCEKPM